MPRIGGLTCSRACASILAWCLRECSGTGSHAEVTEVSNSADGENNIDLAFVLPPAGTARAAGCRCCGLAYLSRTFGGLDPGGDAPDPGVAECRAVKRRAARLIRLWDWPWGGQDRRVLQPQLQTRKGWRGFGERQSSRVSP